MNEKYDVIVMKMSLTRQPTPSDEMFYHRRVVAGSYREAVVKCLPDIRKRVVPEIESDIKFVRVFVGKPKSPGTWALRLDSPYKVDREGRLWYLMEVIDGN